VRQLSPRARRGVRRVPANCACT